MRWDEAQEFPREVFRKLGELGFLGVLFPEEYGGAALSYMDYAAIVEEVSCVDPSIALSLAAHNSLGSNHIFQFGTDAQRRKYMPKLDLRRVARGMGPDGGRGRIGLERDEDDGGPRRQRVGAERLQELHHERIGRRAGRPDGRDRPRQGKPRHLGLRRRARQPGHPRRQEGEQARDAGVRHVHPRHGGLPRSVGCAARRGRRGLGRLDEDPRRRAHLHRRALGRPGARRLRGVAQVLEGAPPVRPADLRVPGHPVLPRRDGDRDRRGAAAHAAGRRREGRRRDVTRFSAQAKLYASEIAVRVTDRGDPDPRRLRLHEGLPGREVLSRRQALHDRRGDERDPEARHRKAACSRSGP